MIYIDPNDKSAAAEEDALIAAKCIISLKGGEV
jgi:hypothetical protein